MESAFIPTILECARYSCAAADYLGEPVGTPRICRDYEIDFNFGAERLMRLDGTEYRIPTNSIVRRFPGQVVSSSDEYSILMLTLDFTHTRDSAPHIRHTVHDVQPENRQYPWELLPVVFVPAHWQEILGMYRALSLSSEQINQRARSEMLLLGILNRIFADACLLRLDAFSHPASYVDGAIEYIVRNYRQTITLDGIAEAVHLNKYCLIRRFRRKREHRR